MYTVEHLDNSLTVTLQFKLFIKGTGNYILRQKHQNDWIALYGYLECKGRLKSCSEILFLCANMFHQPHQPEGIIL